MGIPAQDRLEIVEIGNRLVGGQDPDYAFAPAELEPLLPCSSPVAREMFAFGRRLAALRRARQLGDIVTALVAEGLTQREHDVYFLLLAVAGNETTRHTISHGHFCLGAHLARLELRVFFEQLLRRPIELELTGPPERLRSNFFNGIKRMPVRVSTRR